MTKHSHVIKTGSDLGVVEVYVLYDEQDVLLFRYTFDQIRSAGFEKFSTQLGEDILMSNPTVMQLVDL